jgi:hypothetical protein
MDVAGSSGGRAAPSGRRGWAGWTCILVVGLGVRVVGAAEAATFEGQGRVAAVHPLGNAVTLEHGAIPGLLPPARSEFPVAREGLLEGVRPGDRVRFTLTAPDESHGLLSVASLAPEAADVTWPDRLLTGIAAILALLALATSAVVGLLLWRSLQSLHRRVVALDRETGMLRGGVADTQDGVHQIARALEEAAATFRVGYARDLRRRLAPPAAAAGEAPTGPNGALVVVQRGRGEVYRAVESGAVGPGCIAMWDRRRGERRAGSHHPPGHERRRGDRRASPPETWTRLGFHIVAGGYAEPSRSSRPLRPAAGERGAAH